MSLPAATTSSSTLVAQGITKAHGPVRILENIDLVVGPQHRVGVVGPNGVGKTTLLRVLAGVETADSGRVATMPPTATVGYLAQEPEARPGESLRVFLGRRTQVDLAEKALTEAAEAISSGAAEEGAGAEATYSAALERYLSLGGPDFESRLGMVLHGLGLEERLLQVPMTALSGGQRAKSSLAALLLSRFEVLLLDEPTNDLDFEGLERLEEFLEQREGGLVVVSHDRAFLERVIRSVLELDESTRQGTEYSGGWLAYLDAKATARRRAEEAYEQYVEERARLKAREREQRQWAVQGVAREKKRPKDNDKAQRDFRINRTQKQAAKVRITEKALKRLDQVDKPFESWQLNLHLSAAHRSGDLVALLDKAVVRRGDWQLGPVDLELNWADRVALLGPNGSGKTTLIRALLGQMPLDEGSRRLGASVVVGELRQERGFFGERGRLLNVFLRATDSRLTSSAARSLLAKFGLGAEDVLRKPSTLSPGERTRAELALLMARGTNCLVLDEPTNHLDLPAIEQLEDALGSWTGTLVLVTHDRRFLESIELTRRLELRDGQLSTVRR